MQNTHYLGILFAGLLSTTCMLARLPRSLENGGGESIFNRTPITSSQLVVNLDESQWYQTYLGKADGENQLRKLVETSSLEEAWAFFEDHQRWVELGINSQVWVSPQFIHLSCSFYPTDIQRISYVSDAVAVYHIHPTPSGHIPMPDSAIPSVLDLESMLLTSLLYYSINPAGTYSHRIVSSYGITDFGLTSHGVKYYRDNPRLPIQASTLVEAANRVIELDRQTREENWQKGKAKSENAEASLEDLFGAVQLMQGYFDFYNDVELIQRATQQMSNEAIYVKFLPYQE